MKLFWVNTSIGTCCGDSDFAKGEGVIFSDGTCVLHSFDPRYVVFYDSVDHMRASLRRAISPMRKIEFSDIDYISDREPTRPEYL